MKIIIILLLSIFIYLQYKLWLDEGGIPEMLHLKQEVQFQAEKNTKLKERNRLLEAEVIDLKQGNQAVEERARHGMGMIKEGEVFYQIVP